MTYQKRFSDKSRGIILLDVLLAFALSGLFIVLLTGSSLAARELFEQAQARSHILDDYEAGKFARASRAYGNDRIELTFVNASGTLPLDMRFSSVDAADMSHLKDTAGTPLCSVDFSKKDIVGSYRYFQGQKGSVPHSAVVTPISLPVNPLLPFTDMEIRNGIAYLSADSSVAADPDIIIADIKDPLNVRIISTLNTGPGIVSVALAGQRIFAAAASTAAELHIIRLDTLDLPVLEKKWRLPLPNASSSPPFASSIFYDHGTVYLGTEKWEGDEFNVVDVSDPISPIKRGGMEVGSKVNDLSIHAGIAYLATAAQDQLKIVDVHDPARPVQLASFAPSGWQRQEGKAISYFEGNLGFGRTSGGFDIAQDHEAFARASTSSTTLAHPSSVNIPGGVYGAVSDRSNIFLATRQTDKEFQLFDQALSTTTITAYPLPVAPQAMTCDGDSIYVLAHTAPVIYQIRFK